MALVMVLNVLKQPLPDQIVASFDRPGQPAVPDLDFQPFCTFALERHLNSHRGGIDMSIARRH
jgi:hypothetical protein